MTVAGALDFDIPRRNKKKMIEVNSEEQTIQDRACCTSKGLRQ